jgi:hypothetical protein
MDFDFNKNLTVDSLSGVVPDDFHGLYVEKDGKYVLKTDDPVVGSAVKAVSGLNRALNAARAEARDAKGKIIDLTPLKDFGADPNSILSAFNAQLEEARKTSKSKGTDDVEVAVRKATEALSTKHTSDLEKREARINALMTQLEETLVTSAAISALSEAGAIDVDLALPHIRNQVKVTEENGKFKVNVVDAVGDPRFSGTGNHMTISELVLDMKKSKKYMPLFKSEAPAGGGKPHGGRSFPSNSDGDKSSVDKISAGLRGRRG